MRLVISNYENEALGLIDVFDFDFKNRRAGIGILVRDSSKRNNGYGSEALKLLINYCFTHLNLHQLYCNITESNSASIKLFSNQGFRKVGLKEDWNLVNGSFKNEYLYQKINE